MRLPLPVVGLGLFVLLAGLLALGLWANGNLRAPGLVVPTPVAAATPVPQPTAPVAAAVTPTPVVSTPTPVVASATTQPQAAAATTPVATVAIVATVETAMPTPVVAATASPTSLPTVEPTLAAEISQAYENFWQVKSQALLELDPNHLPDVMDDEYLADTQDLIEQLRAEGRAIKTQVSLDYTVVEASSNSATVVDFFVDNSIYVKLGTEDPLSNPTADRLRVLYRMQRISDTWKVIKSVRSP
jgi:hypothetical protein